MDLEELKKKYEVLKEQYDIPEFDILDKEFEIRDITNENIILREIRERILEKTEQYQKILDSIVQPDTTLINMYESRVFTEKEKEDIFKIFKRLVFLERYSLQTELEDGDAKIAEFIISAYKEWISIKDKILSIIIKLKDSWTKTDDDNRKVEYMG